MAVSAREFVKRKRAAKRVRPAKESAPRAKVKPNAPLYLVDLPQRGAHTSFPQTQTAAGFRA